MSKIKVYYWEELTNEDDKHLNEENE